MSKSKPTIVFVPGSWHSPKCYSEVMDALKKDGHEAVPITLPSNGSNPGKPDMSEDVKAVRSVVAPLVDSGKEVAIVVHSYGSIPTGNALRGLGREERRKTGLEGGVIRLIYLAAFVIQEGNSVLDALGGNDLPWFNVNRETGIVTPDNPETIFYNDLEPEEQKKWIGQLETSSYGCWQSKVEYAAFKEIASTYLFCTEDQALPLPIQQMMVQSVPGSFAEETVKASHSPFLSKPKETIEVIRRAAVGSDIEPIPLAVGSS